nr:50s ribosomal protein l20 [Quercus suber]
MSAQSSKTTLAPHSGSGSAFKHRLSKERKMHKDRILKLAKGFRGRAKNCIRIARERVEKALQYSYRDRRNKKRDMRSLWIQRINAGTRQHGVNYGNFMHGLMKENIQLNRKVLSELSMHEPYSFKALVDISRNAFPGNKNVVLPPKKEGISIVL